MTCKDYPTCGHSTEAECRQAQAWHQEDLDDLSLFFDEY